MVMLLLNLAVIPDEVIKKIDFHPGWSRRFKKSMDQYKEDWNAKKYITLENFRTLTKNPKANPSHHYKITLDDGTFMYHNPFFKYNWDF